VEILPFCSPASAFYMEPTFWRPDPDLDVQVPTDWLVDEGLHWRGLFPISMPPRTHGWKIHVSSTIDDYAAIVAVVSRICFDSGAAFKYVSRWDEVRGSLSKNAHRSSSGKLVTVYPSGDDALDLLAGKLDRALGGLSSPYILGDVRYRSGPVYFRYGGFMPLLLADADEQLLAYPDSAGQLIQDVRSPVFRRPHGPCPEVVEQAISDLALASEMGPLREYSELVPIQFSNAGGVYLATKSDGCKSVLKEARPHAGLDAAGHLAQTRLRREYDNLMRLRGTGIVPGVLDYFLVAGHEFLEIEHVEGMSLLERTSRFCPGLDPTTDSSRRAEYAAQTLEVLEQIKRQVSRSHAEDVVVGDLHPGNIIVTPGGDVVLIDLEDGRSLESRKPGPFHALGYAPPKGFTAAEADWFALSRVAMSVFEPAFAREILAPRIWADLKSQVMDRYGSQVIDFITALEGDFPTCDGSRLLRPEIPPEPARISPATSNRSIVRRMAFSLRDTSREQRMGDPLLGSGLGRLAYGSGLAGLATALHRADVSTPRQWIAELSSALYLPGVELGLFTGLSGISATLAELGHDDDARKANAVIRRSVGKVRSDGFARGLAGIAVQQLDDDVDFAVDLARRATMRSRSEQGKANLERNPGLFRGAAGLAFAQVLVGAAADDSFLLEAAPVTLALEASHRRDSHRGVAGLGESGGRRTFPYLENGAAGFLVAYAALRNHGIIQEVSVWEDAVGAFTQACTAESYAFDGLNRGRAGVLAGLVSVSPWLDVNHSISEQRASLIRSLMSSNGMTFSVGDQLLRLSVDVGTGSAGVLLMLLSVDEGVPLWLPGSISGRVRPSRNGGE